MITLFILIHISKGMGSKGVEDERSGWDLHS